MKIIIIIYKSIIFNLIIYLFTVVSIIISITIFRKMLII